MLLQQDQMEKYLPKSLVYSLLWSMAGDSRLKVRQEMGDFIRKVTTIPLPPSSNVPIIDYEVGTDIFVYQIDYILFSQMFLLL